MKQSMWRMIGSVLVIVAGLSIPLMAQNQGFQGQGQGQGFRGQGGQGIDPQQIQQAQNDMIRDALARVRPGMGGSGAQDPKHPAASKRLRRWHGRQHQQHDAHGPSDGANNQNGQGNNQGGFGNNQNGGRGQIPNIAQMLGIKDSVMSQRMQELQTMLENPDTPDNQIKQKLDSVREARDRACAQLDQARKDLIDLLTTRQEAILFGLGILE